MSLILLAAPQPCFQRGRRRSVCLLWIRCECSSVSPSPKLSSKILRVCLFKNVFGVANQRRCRKLSDTEVVRHGSCPTKPNLTTPEFFGELPCRTNSVSDKFRLPNQRHARLTRGVPQLPTSDFLEIFRTAR